MARQADLLDENIESMIIPDGVEERIYFQKDQSTMAFCVRLFEMIERHVVLI